MTTDTKVNDQIHAVNVRVIGPDSEQIGILPLRDALFKAKQFKMDLVEVAPQANPPVCKIVDWGKHRFDLKKKSKQAKKKQSVVETKEIQLRPVTGQHDLDRKLRDAQKFLDQGKRVRIQMKFRGREIANKASGLEMMRNVIERLENMAVDKEPAINGHNILMVLTPQKPST